MVNENSYYSSSINKLKNNDLYVRSLGDVDKAVEIDGFLFIPNEIKTDQSYSSREYTRTSIMGGGEFVSRSVYKPREFSFETSLDIDPDEPYLYDNVFSLMMNKSGGCEVIASWIGLIKGEVDIIKTYNEATPHSLHLEIKIKEIPSVDALTSGEKGLQFPTINAISDNAVQISKKSTDTSEKKKKVIDYDNPYTGGKPYLNENEYDT